MDKNDYKEKFESELRSQGIKVEDACSWEVSKALMKDLGKKSEEELDALVDYCSNFPKNND